MSEQTYIDATDDDVASELVGKSIASIDPRKNIVTLNDGTELEFQDTADCCAWYSVELSSHLDYADNMITGVSFDDHAPESEGGEDEDYTLHVLSRDKAILDIDVQGNPTSGYYCHSFNLVVRRMAVAESRERES